MVLREQAEGNRTAHKGIQKQLRREFPTGDGARRAPREDGGFQAVLEQDITEPKKIRSVQRFRPCGDRRSNQRQGGECVLRGHSGMLPVTSQGGRQSAPSPPWPTGRCPVQSSTPLGPDQVNVLLLLHSGMEAIGGGYSKRWYKPLWGTAQ
jgi:hypothetical protein